MAKRNEGKSDRDSILIGGKTVDELNPRQREQVLAQFEDEDKKFLRLAILKKHPPYSIAALDVGIRNAQIAIERFTNCIKQENETIAEFTVQKKLCEVRDQELIAAGVDPK